MSTYKVKSACLISLWKTKNIWWSVVHLSKLRALIENAMSVSFLFFWIFHTCREYIFANQMSHFCSHLFFLMISSHPIILFCLSLVHCILRPTKFLSTATHRGMNVDLSSGIWTNCQGLHHWRQSLSFPSVFTKCQWLPKGKLGPPKAPPPSCREVHKPNIVRALCRSLQLLWDQESIGFVLHTKLCYLCLYPLFLTYLPESLPQCYLNIKRGEVDVHRRLSICLEHEINHVISHKSIRSLWKILAREN